jgi:hypothetical protein
VTICCVVRLVKDEEANVAAEVDVAVAERVEEDIGRADDDAVVSRGRGAKAPGLSIGLARLRPR